MLCQKVRKRRAVRQARVVVKGSYVMEHAISERSLERFVTGKASPAENRLMVAHLLKGCGHCSHRLASLLSPEISPWAYDRLFSRLENSVGDTWSALRGEELRPVLVAAR